MDMTDDLLECWQLVDVSYLSSASLSGCLASDMPLEEILQPAPCAYMWAIWSREMHRLLLCGAEPPSGLPRKYCDTESETVPYTRLAPSCAKPNTRPMGLDGTRRSRKRRRTASLFSRAPPSLPAAIVVAPPVVDPSAGSPMLPAPCTGTMPQL